MHARRTHQPRTYDVCFPDEAQADVLRLLDAPRREVINQALTILCGHISTNVAVNAPGLRGSRSENIWGRQMFIGSASEAAKGKWEVVCSGRRLNTKKRVS
jgi:hypothetical protein